MTTIPVRPRHARRSLRTLARQAYVTCAPAILALAFLLMWGFIGGIGADDRSAHPWAALGLVCSVLLFAATLDQLPGGLRAHVHTGPLEIK